MPGELGVSHNLVGDEGQAVSDGVRMDESQGLLAGGLAEKARSIPEYHREDHEPQLVDEVMLDQRVYELVTRVYKDFAANLLLQLRDLAHRIAAQDRRVGPFGNLQGGGHDVLGHAV